MSLEEAPYGGTIISIEPERTFGSMALAGETLGGEPIVITGEALDADENPVPTVPLDLALRVRGFERVRRVWTDAQGEFEFVYQPQAGESGTYLVSVLYPGGLERPVHGSFTIDGLVIEPTALRVRMPRHYEQEHAVVVRAAEVTAATDVRLEYLAADQGGLALVPGVAVTVPAPVSLAPGASAVLAVQFSGSHEAPASGLLRLRLVSEESDGAALAFVLVEYEFGNAAPVLYHSPSFIETGVVHDGAVVETLRLENLGLAPLDGVELDLLTASGGQPAPGWIFLATPRQLGSLAPGGTQTIELHARPGSSVADGFHEFVLRVSAPGQANYDIPVVVAVTEDGTGNLWVHVSDIYTATLDENDQPIPGLAGARVVVQHEDVFTIRAEGVTDAAGEVLFEGLPAGSYRVRVSAPKHDDTVAHVRVRPGMTTTEEIFLMNRLISIEWHIEEIALLDRYEIVLRAVYETQVPAAVVVLEPASVALPDLRPGEVYAGELTATNYGLIRADNVRFFPPGNSDWLTFEFLASVPRSIAASQRVTIPFRVTALRSLAGFAHASASGGGSCTSGTCIEVESTCANGMRTGSRSCTSFVNSAASAIARVGCRVPYGVPPGPGGGANARRPDGPPCMPHSCSGGGGGPGHGGGSGDGGGGGGAGGAL